LCALSFAWEFFIVLKFFSTQCRWRIKIFLQVLVKANFMESVVTTLREPVVSFVILLAVILVVPPIFERLRLPGLVGLIAAGVLLGSSGLGLLNQESETMKLFSDIGKIYLMFVAGLEIDLQQFRRTRNRSLGFGGATFLLPLLAGILVGRLFGFGWNAAILIGSLLASHTLLAYPIVQRLGVVKDEAVTVTIGATIFTDIGALLVLAICTGVSQGDFSTTKLVALLAGLAIYSLTVLLGLSWLGKYVFRRTRDDQGNQFLFVLLGVFLASVGAQLIGVENIVGAFLAGLAINDVVGEGPVKEKIEFVGSVLFIPIFFVSMGLLLDLKAFRDILASIGLPLTIVAALLVSKFLAAWVTKGIFRYSWMQTLTMWSLSLPQVAATLAAALVGYQAEIISLEVFNSVILLMLVTAVMGPLITTRTASRLAEEVNEFAKDEDEPSGLTVSTLEGQPLRVVVPVYNPQTERYLLELASLVTRHESGELFPLAIAKAQSHMDSPQLSRSLQRSQQLLDHAKELSEELGVNVAPQLRIEYDVAQGISHASREVNANLIVLGFSERQGFRSQLFGNITDQVVWSAHCLVAIARMHSSPLQFQRILVPIENFSASAMRPLRFAKILAAANQANITLLQVCRARTPISHRAWNENQLALVAKRLTTEGFSADSRVVAADNVTAAILRESTAQDVVLLRFRRRRIGADGLAVGTVTTPLLQRLTCSVVLLGEPHQS
jgi:Kef-type K+ transport system membrane component KefB